MWPVTKFIFWKENSRNLAQTTFHENMRICPFFNYIYVINQKGYSFLHRHTALFSLIYPECQGVFQKTVDKLRIYAVHIHYQTNHCKVSFSPLHVWQNCKTDEYRCSDIFRQQSFSFSLFNIIFCHLLWWKHYGW